MTAVAEGRSDAPGLGALEVINLPDWPRLGLERPRLVVVEPRAKRQASALTPRQQQILAAAGAHADLRTAADDLGVTLTTLRTHLKNVYRKLGVSGLSEAIALHRLA